MTPPRKKPAARAAARPHIRLLKVIVQPVLVLDDGESLVEQRAQATEIPAAELHQFAERLEQQIAAHNAQEGP